MHDPEGYYFTLKYAIGQLRIQLADLSPDDPRRVMLYRDLLWCYAEAFALLRRQLAAHRTAAASQVAQLDAPDAAQHGSQQRKRAGKLNDES